jgi:K+/H+ antiporter YhaU regulatory subunit KhtT
VAIVKNEEVITEINPEMPFEADMKLIVIANINKLKKLHG